MTRYGLTCLVFGSLVFISIEASGSSPTAQKPAVETPHAVDQPSKKADPEDDRVLITISGICDDSSSDRVTAPDCKTVITRDQFEKVIYAVQPNMSPHARREFALHYVDVLIMTQKAEQMGLDKGSNYEEQMRLARIQVLSQELKKVMQERASQISEEEIEEYYHANIQKFEKAEIDRIYIPKSLLTKEIANEDAESLRTRAIAGEQFDKLQAAAYQTAGIKSAIPNTSLVVKRTSLPPNQAPVMDLKTGEVSSVLTDPNGYVIYKLESKEIVPLDQVREEIKTTLRSQRMKEEMGGIMGVATPTLDESYFAR